jgi:hypothetical protein
MTKPVRVLSLSILAPFAFLALAALPAQAGENTLGAGIHYWRTVDELRDDGVGDIDSKGTSGVLSYQHFPGGLLGWEIDLEYFDKGFSGSTDEAYAPQIYLVLGHHFYAAAGVGVTYSSGLEKSPSDPFYAGRVGISLLLLPSLSLDVNANYRANTFKGLGDAASDTVTLGALLRVTL